ncbi:MAG: aspartate aminotransferase family protein [Cyanothece sp. SIO2G6]|nr:aspartate aminotransferase family protein [Cyanothece sp. SIO2G6]
MPTTTSPPHLDSLIQRYIQKTPGSKRYAQDARRVMADKTSLGLGFSPELKEICYPVVAERSAGSRLWDIDGNEYIDILMGLGTNLLGHNPSFVKEAIAAQLEKGIQLGAQAELAGEVAQLVHQVTGAERVTFSNTGTEAIMTAIRIARTATNCPKIAVFTNSYHGHSDNTLVRAPLSEYAKKAALRVINKKSSSDSWLRSLLGPIQSLLSRNINPKAVPAALGIPAETAANVMVLDYGNPRSLNILRKEGSKLAAVLVEPVQSRCPEIQPRAFLQELRQVTQATNTALIFDEMVTGFRIHPGGAQAWFEVEADLVTYSKIVGGGLPLSVITGKAQYMDHIDGGQWSFGDRSAPTVKTTFFAGTFCKHPLSLAAARSVLLHLKAAGPQLQQDLNQKTGDLVAQLNSYLQSESIPMQFVQFGSFFSIDGSKTSVPLMALNLLSYHLLTKGIHLRQGDKGGFLSTAHSPEDIDTILQAFKESFSELKTGGLING